jgi:hypothetical protein
MRSTRQVERFETEGLLTRTKERDEAGVNVAVPVGRGLDDEEGNENDAPTDHSLHCSAIGIPEIRLA